MTPREGSILIGLKKLRIRLFEAHKYMDKWRQRSLGNWLLEGSARTLRYAALAYDNQERRFENILLAIAEFTVVRADLEYAVQSNAFHFPKRELKQGEADTAGNRVSTQLVQLFELVAEINNDMLKWKASILKGTTVCESSMRQSGNISEEARFHEN